MIEEIHAAVRRELVASADLKRATAAYREMPTDNHAEWVMFAWAELRAAVNALVELSGPLPGAKLALPPAEGTRDDAGLS